MDKNFSKIFDKEKIYIWNRRKKNKRKETIKLIIIKKNFKINNKFF